MFIGVGQGRPGTTQMPDEVGGEHADQDVRADPFGEAVVDRAQVQVVDLDGADVSFPLETAGDALAGIAANRGRWRSSESPG
jgi:hypothetical protein